MLIVAGKGGVGKTTISAAIARAAARSGFRVLVAAVDVGSPLGELLGRDGPISAVQPVDCGGGVWAQLVTPAQSLDEYLDGHGLGLVSRAMARSGVLDIVATAAPGIDDIVVLGKLKALERAAGHDGPYDLVVVDAPAAGHAVTFLRSPRALSSMIRVGPIATQAREAAELLGDGARCRVVLVTLAEETPVNEAIETAFALEDELGLTLGPIVVNGLYPDLVGLDVPSRGTDAIKAAARFRLTRSANQHEQLARLAAALPLPQRAVPFIFSAGLGPADIDTLADALC